MLKKVIIVIMMFSMSMAMMAQDTYIVSQFGVNLSNWASGNNPFSAFENIQQLCSKKNPSFRISDNLVNSLARINGQPISKHYPLNMFTTWLQKEIDKGIVIKVSNFHQIPLSEIENSNDSYGYVSCNIQITGALDFNESALFLITNGKIARVQNYVSTIDTRTGKRKIEVDWSGLDIDEDTEGFVVSYNYSKAFPFGASITYSKWKFMIGVDFGINNDKDIYTTQKVYFNNIVDYKIDRGEYDLKYFITVTPSFYMKYFSVGWGVGYAYLKGTKYTKDNSLTVYPDGTTIQTGSTTSVDDFKYKWMMRPTIKGYIPCSDNFFISLSVNYDWIVGYKEKSGIGFGAGIHILFD